VKEKKIYALQQWIALSAQQALSLNELNQNKQKFTHTSMTQQQKFTLVSTTWWWLVIPQLYEGIKEPALKREGNCQSEYRHSSCD
jgi:hypothetical protein